jgi:hypothetical protein
MKTGINVGTSPEAVVAARAAILDILKSTSDQATKQKALDTLKDLCAFTGPTNISGCVIGDHAPKKP